MNPRLVAGLGNSARLCISAIWVWGGIHKLMVLDEFREVVAKHGLVAPVLAPAMPIVEIVLGFATFGSSARHVPRALLLSALVIMMLSGYLILVLAPRLQQAGCGCSPVLQGDRLELGWLLARNLCFLGLHGVVMFTGRPVSPADSRQADAT